MANKVLPVPGGPTRRIPFGIFAPTTVYFSGSFKNETISSNSAFASSIPAISLKLTPVSGRRSKRAVDFPKLNGDCPEPPPKLSEF